MKTIKINWIFLTIWVVQLSTILGSDLYRERRQIIVNPNADLSVALILLAGLQLMLPTLVDHEYDDLWYEVNEKGRSFKDSAYNESLNSLPIDPGYADQLHKILLIFHSLEINTVVCQERFLCELAADVNSYSPVSELLLKELKPNRGPMHDASLMAKYKKASNEGILSNSKTCGLNFKGCPLPANKQLNMSVLKMWQFIASKTNIKFIGFK